MKDTMRIEVYETALGNFQTSVQGFIDDFWASVDVSHTPASIDLTASIKTVVKNASNVEKTFPSSFRWFEDAATQNTRMKNIFVGFCGGITNMEAASSYTTIVSMSATISISIIYT